MTVASPSATPPLRTSRPAPSLTPTDPAGPSQTPASEEAVRNVLRAQTRSTVAMTSVVAALAVLLPTAALLVYGYSQVDSLSGLSDLVVRLGRRGRGMPMNFYTALATTVTSMTIIMGIFATWFVGRKARYASRILSVVSGTPHVGTVLSTQFRSETRGGMQYEILDVRVGVPGGRAWSVSHSEPIGTALPNVACGAPAYIWTKPDGRMVVSAGTALLEGHR